MTIQDKICKAARGTCLALLCLWNPAMASDRVLVVHSYHKGFQWVEEINEVIGVAFRIYGISHRIFYMDTMRQSSEASKKAAAMRAKQLVAKYEPKVVIAVDDDAQAYFAKDYVNKSDIQVVFCGVNADPETYNYPAANTTGILERTYPLQTLNTLKTLLPKIKRVAVISDDSATSKVVLLRIKRIMDKAPPGSTITIARYAQPSTFSAWKQAVTDFENDKHIDALMIPQYHTVKNDGTISSVRSSDVMDWTVEHTTKPVVGLWPHIINNGGLLAVTVYANEHGRNAALMAIELLAGKKAGEIPMQVNEIGHVRLNLMNKEHLGFDASLNMDQVADYIIR